MAPVSGSSGMAAVSGSAGRASTSGSSGSSAGRAGGQAGVTGSAGMSSTGSAADTYHVQNGLLYDTCGEQVILRGINHPTIYIDREGKALPEIAKTGANSVRLFWYATRNVAISEAETVIQAAISNHMVPILEMHDSTCEWSLDGIVDYWTSSEAVALIERYKAHLIVNIANEPSAPSTSQFTSKYSAVVQTMRSAGIHVPLMIDGGTCGRDYQMLLDGGPAVLQADPDHNLIFSAHLYDPLSASELGAVYDSFITAKLPFVVGEFANKEPPGCGRALDYNALITQAEQRGVGWLAWSWGDDDSSTIWNDDCAEFDMTDTFSYDTLKAWGKEVAVTSPASLMNTAKRPRSLTNGSCQ